MENAGSADLELTLEKPVHGGDCIAHHEGKVYFVRYGLPGETVVAEIVKNQKNIAFAQVKNVLQASCWRRNNPWPESGYAGVGAAELAHVNPRYQRYWKAQVLAESFSRIGGVAVEQEFMSLFPHWKSCPVDPDSTVIETGLEMIKPAPVDDCADGGWGWRLRLDFIIGADRLPVMKGYRSDQSYSLKNMPLARPAIWETGIFTNPEKWASCYQVGDHIRIWDTALGVRVCVEDRIYDSRAKLVNEKQILQKVSGWGEFWLNPWGFWQPHFQAAEVLALEASKHLDADSKVALELYAGAGLFTSVLIKGCPKAQVTTIEGYQPAVLAAQEKFKAEIEKTRVRILDGRIDNKKVASLIRKKRPDIVLLDPPRAGAGQAVMREISSAGPSKIIYIACDIASLARDVAVLVNGGYQIESLQGFDLFPNTHHFETVCVLSRV